MLDMAVVTPLDLDKSLQSLIDADQFQHALQLAERHWGPWAHWREPAQLKIAIELLMHIGNERAGSALALRAWRRFPNDADFCQYYLFHRLETRGLIVMERELQRLRSVHAQGKYGDTDNILSDAVIALERKDLPHAELLIDQALQKHPDYLWAQRLKVALLDVKEQRDEYLAQAKALYDARQNLATLNLYVAALRKNNQLSLARDVLWAHCPKIQSCRPWRQLMNLCLKLHDFEGLARAFDAYQQQVLSADRDELHGQAITWMRLLLNQGDIAGAIQALESARGSYAKYLIENLKQASAADVQPVQLPVPHEIQEHLTCAPATMTALCRYFGYEVKQRDIIQAICFDGTPELLERRWLTNHGFSYIERQLTPELCYQLIDAKLPFAFVTTGGMGSHLQAVIGYHKALGVALLMDPSIDVPVEYLLKEGLEAEAAACARALIFVPNDQAHRLEPFQAPDVAMFALWDQFSEARSNRDLLGMQHIAQQFAEQYPKELMSQLVARAMAIELEDEVAIEQVTQQLLQQYPDSVPWRLSQMQSYLNQGHLAKAVEYLQQELAVRPHYELRLRLFRLIYNLQPYQTLAAEIRQEMERYGSYQAAVYQQLAHHDWHLKNYESATRHYYIACCLDDTNTDNFQSYFRACRFLKRTEQGMALAKQHFDKYAKRSDQPARLLFSLYEQQTQYSQAMAVLEQALSFRPDDIALLEFALSEYLNQSQLDAFSKHLALAESRLPATRYQYWLGRRAEWDGDHQVAAQHFQPSFAASPLNYTLAVPYLRALKRSGNLSQLKLELDALTAQADAHLVVWDYLADFHPDPAVEQQAIEKLASLFPHNIGRQRNFIRVCLEQQRLAEARERAEQLCAQQPQHVECKMLLARVCRVDQQLDQAEQLLREILLDEIDHDEALAMLFELRPAADWKQQQLDFALAQMTTQTLYGNAIYDFWVHGQAVMTSAQRARLITDVIQPNLHLWQSRTVWAWALQSIDVASAIGQLRQCCDDFPLMPRPFIELAYLYRINQQTEEAIQCYRTALQLNPSWSYASRQLAEFLESQGRYNEVVEVMLQALRYQNTDAVLYGYLADAYRAMNLVELALANLRRAVALDPNYIWAWRTWHDLVKNDKHAMVSLQNSAEASVNKHPHSVGALRLLADLHQGEPQLNYLRRAIDRQPRHVEVHQELLSAELEQGHFDAVFAHLQQYFADAAERPLSIVELHARALADIGNQQAAADLLANYLKHAHAATYYYRKLFGLLENVGDKTRTADFALLLKEREPHDATALCRAGEALEGLKNDKYHQVIDDCYRRAFALNPADQYIGLTLIDWLQQQQQWADADAALQQLSAFSTDGWVLARRVVSAVCQQKGELTQVWRELLQVKLNNLWVYETPLLKASDEQKLAMLQALQQAISEGSFDMGRVYARQMLALQKEKYHKELEKFMVKSTMSSGIAGAWYSYLHHFIRLGQRPARALFEKQFSNWQRYPSVLSAAAEICSSKELWSTTKTLLDGLPRHQRSMQINYQELIARLALNDQKNALRLATEGMALERDNFFHNLLLWDVALNARQGQRDLSIAQQINNEELTRIERWVHRLLLLLAELTQTQLPASEALQRFQAWVDSKPDAASQLRLHWLKPLIDAQQLPMFVDSWWHRLRLTWVLRRL